VEFIPERVTVNKYRYKEILHHLRNTIQHKHPGLWHKKNWLLYMTTLCLFKRSWQNNRALSCHNLHTQIISCHVIYFSFPARKKSCVGGNSSELRRSSLPQGKPYGTFLQISLNSVSSSYTNGGRLPQWPKGRCGYM
jgi:hypothetical protein